MADIVECPNCKELVEWPNILCHTENSIEYHIGCSRCLPDGVMLVGHFFSQDHVNLIAARSGFDVLAVIRDRNGRIATYISDDENCPVCGSTESGQCGQCSNIRNCKKCNNKFMYSKERR